MSRYSFSHSLDDVTGGLGFFMDPAGGPGMPAPVKFEFDNFGVPPQPASTLSATGPSVSTVKEEPNNFPCDSAQSTLHESQMHSADIKPPVDIPDHVQSEETHEIPPNAIIESDNHLTDDAPVIDIRISNVVSSFGTRCHLNLRKIAMEGMNVVLRKESGMVSMKLRRPKTTASIWSSGKITCTGAISEEEAKIAARRFARCIQKMGFPRVKVVNFRVVNVLGTCSFPFGIRIQSFSKEYPKTASYEPELHPGVTYRITSPKATLKIFSTGSITVTAPRVQNVQTAIEHIFPLVYNYRMDTKASAASTVSQAQIYVLPSTHSKSLLDRKRKVLSRRKFDESDEEEWSETDEDDSDD